MKNSCSFTKDNEKTDGAAQVWVCTCLCNVGKIF